MGSSIHRTMVELRWDKLVNFEDLLRRSWEPPAYRWGPDERWRARVGAITESGSYLPPARVCGPEYLLLLCFIRLHQERKHRRDMKELTDTIHQIDFFNRLVTAIRAPGHETSGLVLDDERIDQIYTLLWNVQKVDNPLAVRPQSDAADTLAEDMEAIAHYMGRPLRVKALD